MKSNNDFAALVRRLSRRGVDGRKTTVSVIGSAGLGTTVPGLATRSSKPGRAADLRSQALTAKTTASALKFGSPSSSSTASSSSTPEWENLLKQTASGGLSSALGGGFLSAIGGLGGLVSGIASLFGGSKKTVPAAVRFELPESQSQTVYIGANSNVPSGAVTNVSYENAGTPLNGQASGSNNAVVQLQSSHIVQTVKQAILTSSSLNDVISEI